MSASSILQCPDCSRLVHFSHPQTTIVQCEGCGTVIWRKPNGNITTTSQFPILEKNDIIQPGSTGKWKERKFTVLGRFRAWLEESAYNYWTILFDDGKLGMLGEGYGLYTIMQPIPVANGFDSRKLKGTHNGNLQGLRNDDSFLLKNKQSIFKWEFEGELLAFSTSNDLIIADFSSEKGEHITVFDWDQKIYFYEAEYVPFEELSLQDLRTHHYSEKKFSCTNCSASIAVKTYPYAQSCSCVQCGMTYELKNGIDLQKAGLRKEEGYIFIPLGSTGKINDIEYEVIGYVRKEEQNEYKSQWSEYTLFNPQHGFAFLSEYQGHWIYVREQGDSPILTNARHKQFTYKKDTFQLYNSYSYKAISAAGEFPYNIFDNWKSEAREFINPPHMWIEEREPNEGISWYSGEHVNAKKLEKSFSVVTMPHPHGVGALTPSGYIPRNDLFKISLFGLLVILLVHFSINMSKQERILMEKTYNFPDSSNTVSEVTEKFRLDKWSSNILFDIQAGVKNSWFEMAITLVNAETGKEYSLEKGVEYYAGYSDGESWSEGSQRDYAYLNRIPAGTYFLQLQGTREGATYTIPSIRSFFLRVVYDVPVTRNLIWSLALLLIWPVALGVRTYIKEGQRWENSPFGDYNS